MPRRRISDTDGEYDYAVTIEGPDDDTVDAAAEAGVDAVEDTIADDESDE